MKHKHNYAMLDALLAALGYTRGAKFGGFLDGGLSKITDKELAKLGMKRVTKRKKGKK